MSNIKIDRRAEPLTCDEIVDGVRGVHEQMLRELAVEADRRGIVEFAYAIERLAAASQLRHRRGRGVSRSSKRRRARRYAQAMLHGAASAAWIAVGAVSGALSGGEP